jgi:hypothetical protein
MVSTSQKALRDLRDALLQHINDEIQVFVLHNVGRHQLEMIPCDPIHQAGDTRQYHEVMVKGRLLHPVSDIPFYRERHPGFFVGDQLNANV